MYQRVSQCCKINPVVRMQMRDRHRADLRERTDTDTCSEWRVRAVTKIQYDRCRAMLHQVPRRAGTVVCAIRARRTEDGQR